MKHPMQPVEWDVQGVIRFKSNAIVRHVVGVASEAGCDLNRLATLNFSDDDWTQFAQLIGYSVSGARDLDYMDSRIIDRADRAAAKLVGKRARQ